jgi:hypothetical protein
VSLPSAVRRIVATPLTLEDRSRVQIQYGLRLRDYNPNLAYLERLPPDVFRALKSDDMVRAMVPYQPAFKLAPLIGRVPVRTDERRAATGAPLDATLFDDADPAEVTTQLTDAGAIGINVFG